MPSTELLAFNADARTRKAMLSGDYDPIAMRAAIAVPSAAAPATAIVETGGFSIERRGGADRERLIVAVAGGGFCFPAGDQHRLLLDRLCLRLDAQAALIHHRLAPEHPFPAAYDDVLEGLRAAAAFDGVRRIDVIADSSGASLMLCALITRRDRGDRLPTRCVFMSALTDLAMTGLSHVSNCDRDPLFGPSAIIHKGWHYLQGANPTDPRASPFWADVHGLAPMLMLVGDTEVMRDDTVRFADKVNRAGGTARVSLCAEAPHVYPLIAGLPEAESAFAEICDFLSAS